MSFIDVIEHAFFYHHVKIVIRRRGLHFVTSGKRLLRRILGLEKILLNINAFFQDSFY